MKTFEEVSSRLDQYQKAHLIYDPAVGYISYRVGTGENVEILFISAVEPGKGHGEELLKRMVRAIEDKGPRPYYSVFAFVLMKNTTGREFYRRHGFRERFLAESVYAHDDAMLKFVEYKALKKNLGI